MSLCGWRARIARAVCALARRADEPVSRSGSHRESYEEPTVGIVLCSDKNEAMVRITLPEDNRQILASRYPR